jgi:group I intron endonuclease
MKNDICGIYQIQSKIKPERIYVGSAVEIKSRWSTHRYLLRNNKHHSKKLQHHYNKYGEDDLIFSVIAICIREDLIPINGIIRPEQFFIWAYDPYFNEAPFAGSLLGFKFSEETIAKHRGVIVSAETRKKQSESQKRIGNKPPSAKGRKQTEEHKAKRKLFKKGHKSWLGKKHKPETILKMKNSAKNVIPRSGFKQSPEWVEKRVKGSRGRKRSPEEIETGRLAQIKWYETHDSPLKGRTRPSEVVVKIQEATRKSKVSKKLSLIMQSLLDAKNNPQ